MTKPKLADHPDYPLRAEIEILLEARASDFEDAPRRATVAHRLLTDFVVLAHRFAFLERLIQGEILYDLPVHRQAVLKHPGMLPGEEGELLAQAESALLEWAAGPASELAAALDDIGIKVLLVEEGQLPQTDEAGVPDPGLQVPEAGEPDHGSVTDGACSESETGRFARDLVGAFYFVGEVGPALLAGAGPEDAATAFVLAHGLAHLVADIDPYRSRFCRWDAATMENRVDSPVEVRADRFARALLMPEDRFRCALAQLGPAPGEAGASDRRCDQLAAFFEAPVAIVRRRLADLGLPCPGGEAPVPPAIGPAAETIGKKEPASRQTETPPDGRLLLEDPVLSPPERFANLALAAYSARVMETDDLARFLGSSEDDVLRMIEWAGITRLPESDYE